MGRRTLGIVAIAALMAGPAVAQEGAPTVGMPARVAQLVLPGPELEARPIDRSMPVVVRVVATYPHGDAFRYDLEYYGLEPGRYDLAESLRRKDGSPTADLPPIPVAVVSKLPPGQVEPHRPGAAPMPSLGGYRLLLAAGGGLWLAGLVLIVMGGRRRRSRAAAGAGRRATLADRLRPLVEKAAAGTLATVERAELERLLLGYWRRKLKLDDLPPGEVMAALRGHPEAGATVERLEAWLHRPGGEQAVGPEELAALLAPYRDLPADAVDGGPATAGRAA